MCLDRRHRLPAWSACTAAALMGCHDDSQGPPKEAPIVTNLGLQASLQVGTGALRLFSTLEDQHGADLDGDGDRSDEVFHVLDLEAGTVLSPGLALGRSVGRTDVIPQPLVVLADALAVGVSEFESGERDRNGDGDAFDVVLAVHERGTGAITNLGLALSRMVGEGRWLAFDVSESAQGQDLDGSGSIDPGLTVPHVHDLESGATRNTQIRGARVVAIRGDSLVLALAEWVVGDRNGDLDELDVVLAFHDLLSTALEPSGLAVATGLTHAPRAPVAFPGGWAVMVDESSQCGLDLNGDGDAWDEVTFAFDLASGATRNLGSLTPRPSPPDAPLLLLYESVDPPGPDFYRVHWTYDPRLDRLDSTELSSVDAFALGEVLAVLVDELHEGQDLDANGRLESDVIVLYDPASRSLRNLGLDGTALPHERGLLILSFEPRARRDWNLDGDQQDLVLWTWERDTDALTNTGLSVGWASALGPDAALLTRWEQEAAQDWNGDGDRDDTVAFAYDLGTGRAQNLGVSVVETVASSTPRTTITVHEEAEGRDLNGDLDLTDQVLHRVELR